MAGRRGLHGIVVDDLGRRIVHGEVAPGTVLVPDEIGESHGASRTVVRETMRVLEAKGLITARPNVGTQVSASDRWHGLDLDVLRWRLSGPDQSAARRELHEMRRTLEPMIARLAAERAGAEVAASLLACADAMHAALERSEIEVFTAADVEFHERLFAAAGNSILNDLSTLVSTALDDRAPLVAGHGISAHAVALHETVAAAVRDRDAALAGDAMAAILDEQA